VPPEDLPKNVWCTAVVLALLAHRHAAEEDEWARLARKARKYIKSHCDRDVQEIVALAAAKVA
jgi:hypothetical protein